MSRRLFLLPCVAVALAVLVWALARPGVQPAAPSNASPVVGTSTLQDPGTPPPRPLVQVTSAVGTAGDGRRALTTLEGTVRVAGEGLPLADVLVRVEEGPESTTDENGRFALPGLSAGPLRLHAEAGEGFQALSRELELQVGAQHVELELVPRFDLVVLVDEDTSRSARERTPVAGARVRLRSPRLRAMAEPEAALAEGTTDAQGRCDLRDLPPGEHELVVEAAGHASARVLLPFHHRDRRTSPHLRRGSISVRLDRDGIVLRGRVIGPGRSPVPDALVCLDDPGMRRRASLRARPHGPLAAPRIAFTDATGAFELTLPEGASEVAVLACTTQEGLSPVARAGLPRGHPQGPLVVHVPAATQVELRVVDAAGQPALGRLQVGDGVLAYDLLGDPLLAAVPGLADALAPRLDPATGTLRLRLPEGGYRVRFDGDEPTSTLGTWYVRVGPGSPREHELRLPSTTATPTPSGL